MALDNLVESAIEELPVRIHKSTVRTVIAEGPRGVERLIERNVNPRKAILAGIAIDPEAWSVFSARYMNCSVPSVPEEVECLVIGSGFHGTTFAANYGGDDCWLVNYGGPGGVFGFGNTEPLFYLNSRNRPGELGSPGSDNALNFMPGGVVQPSDINAAEYQTQDVMAKCIMLNHMALPYRFHESAYPVDRVVLSNDPTRPPYLATFVGGGRIYAETVVLATGLGTDRYNPTGVYPFTAFLEAAHYDSTLTQDVKRAAIVGAGDSGKIAMEYLLGQGPKQPLDFIPNIDWFGLNQAIQLKEDWERCNRSRYAGIGRSFPRSVEDYAYRITPRAKLKRYVYEDEGVSIEYGDFGQITGPFGLVIDCRGFRSNVPSLLANIEQPLEPLSVPLKSPELFLGLDEYEAQMVARKVRGESIYVVGPAAEVPLESREKKRVPALRGVKENVAAMFRYAPWTAALARYLGGG